MNAIKTFLSDDTAATAVEYAVMLAFILMALIGTVRTLGDANSGLWGKNDAELKKHGF